MQQNSLRIICFLLTVASIEAVHLMEGLYCGKEVCYDILGVSRDASKSEIAKNYRKLARQYHPDLHRDVEAKAIAEEQFKRVATAYEILKDDESRTDYDYMLDNPDQYYAHYYRYYRRRVAPKVDVRLVIFVTLTIISAIQYYSARQRYDDAIKYFMTMPKYRNRALDIAKEENMINLDNKRDKRSKTEQKEELERVLKTIIENKMDIKGAYAKPTIYDILWIQLIILPYTIIKWIYWYISFFWRHAILRIPYNHEEKLYLIRRNLKMGQQQFESLDDHLVDDYLRKELWIKSKFVAWKKEYDDEMKAKMAENTRYKQYRRYVKRYGVGRITFDDS